MFGFSTIVSRIVLGLAVLLLFLGGLQVRSCMMARQQAAQSKVDRGQAGAARESAQDALNTQSAVHANDMQAADLSRVTAQEVRDAKGSDARVDPAAAAAQLRAFCRRPSGRNHERCRMQQPHTGGMAPAR